MIKIGIIGWRGLVGSVLLNRIKNSEIFKFCNIYLCSTSYVNNEIYNAFEINFLKSMKIIISCQGSNYTKKILKNIIKNWNGYWIDASSYLRLSSNNFLILDIINKEEIKKNIKNYKIYSGCNCTVSLCLIALKNLIKKNLVDWVITSSYQAISGAGSELIKKLLNNINNSYNLSKNLIFLEKEIKFIYKKNPILYNAIPWIDDKVNFGQTKEEWKSTTEARKLLNSDIKIDSNCVRISSLRCHSQEFYLKIKKNLSIENIYELLNHKFIKIIKNDNFNTINKLNPFYVSGKLQIFLGRIRKNLIDKKIINIFSVGDQLLWGAAEPIKRFLEILINYLL